MKKRKKSLNNLSNFGNSELIYKTVYESPIGKIFIYSEVLVSSIVLVIFLLTNNFIFQSIPTLKIDSP